MDQYKENENNQANDELGNENVSEPSYEEIKSASQPDGADDAVPNDVQPDFSALEAQHEDSAASDNTQEYDKARSESGSYSQYPGAQQSSQYSDSGAYTWQNPNPYNAYNNANTYAAPAPARSKKKLSGAAVALIGVSSVAFVLLMAVIVMFVSMNANKKTGKDPVKDNNTTQNNKNESNTERDPNVNLPSLETQQPTNGALSVPQIYEKVKDSVVGIIVTATNGSQIAQGSSTGIILSEDGYIATNAHVVDGAATIKVVLTDESEYTAELIGSDSRTDLAVLKIDKTGLQPAEFGDSDALVVGETVVAIGNPYGLELAGTVTSGIVSALNRRIVIESVYMTLIQTDASINPGNSGGPLVNAYGQVIGITSSKIVNSGYEGIGFAIPITGATDIIGELIQYGYIKDRPYIGIQGSDLDATYAQLYSIPQGVYVQYVDPESDAYAKGLKKGDIIIAVNGTEIKNMAELDEEKNKHSPGDSVTLTIYRNTRKTDITIILSETSGN